MAKKKKSNFDKFVLLLAIIMMAGSALISFFVVRENHNKISALEMEVEEKQVLIRDIWNATNTKEIMANNAMLLSVLADESNEDAARLKTYYLSQFPRLTATSQIPNILKTLEQEKKNSVEYINNLYLEQTAIHNKIFSLEQLNSLFSGLAVFLQLISLILIILRHDIPHGTEGHI